jgi:hypothetical protein
MQKIAPFALSDHNIVELVQNVIDCMIWCRAARNEIIHAEYYPIGLGAVALPPETMTITKRKNKRSSKNIIFILASSELRSAVDFMHSSKIQAVRLVLYFRFYHLPQSEIPAI